MYILNQVQSIPDDGESADDSIYHNQSTDIPHVGLNIAMNYWFANATSPIDDIALLGISMSNGNPASPAISVSPINNK